MSNLTVEQQFHVNRRKNSLFLPILACMFALFTGFGFYLSTVKIMPKPVAKVMRSIQTNFTIVAPKKVAQIKPKVEKPKPIEPKVYDLTKPVELKSKEDKIVEKPDEKPAPRQVYGVKQVYSKGLGAGGSMSDAVVGKLGNTTNKEFDDIKATKKDLKGNGDLKGEIVSTVTVTQIPLFRKRVKAEITDEIKASGITGIVKVKVLVDIDGLVKQAIVQNDLGFGTAESALKACLQMEFTPALKGETPVAVWITIPVKFEKTA